MSDETTQPGVEPDKSRFRTELRRWRWPLIGVAVLLFLAGLVYLVVPLAIRYVATSELEAMGATEVEIGAVEFDPFDAAATMSNLAVTGRDGDRLTGDRLVVQVDLGDLFSSRIHLAEIAIEGALLDVRRLETGGILFAGLAPLSDGAVEEEEEEEGGWQFGFGKLTIARSRLHYAEPDFETTLVLDDLAFGRVLAWQPDETSNFSFSGTLDDSTLSAEGTAMPFAPVNRGDLEFDISGLNLAAFETVLRDAGLPTLSGVVDARVALTTALSASEPPQIAIEGRIGGNAVSLGLETGDLSGDTIVWTGRISYDGARDDYLELDGTLKGEGVDLPAGSGPANAGSLNWEGRIALSEPDDQTMIVKLDGTASLDTVSVSDGGESTLTIRSVRLRDLAGAISLGPDGEVGLDQSGGIQISGIQAAEPGRTVDLETLSWTGKVAQSPGGASLTLNGALVADKLSVRADEAGETASLEKLELPQSVFALKRLDGAVSVTHDGPITAAKGQLDTPQVAAQEGRVAWTGKIAAQVAADGSLTGDLDGSLRTEDAVVRLVAQDLALSYHSLVFEGSTSIAGTADGAITSRTAGRTAIEALSLTDRARGLEIISFEKVAVEGVEGTERGLASAESLEATGIRIGTPVPDAEGATEFEHVPMHIAAVRVDGVGALDAAAVRLGEVTVTDMSLAAVRDKEGLIQLPIVLTAQATAPASGTPVAAPDNAGAGQAAETAPAEPADGSDTPPAAASGATEVAIDSLIVGGKSTLTFEDRSVDPEFRVALDGFELVLKGLDSAKPGSPAQLGISGAIGEFSSVNATGTVSPFADPASTDMKIELENINLPPLSVYSARYLGYRLDTGELDAVIDLKVSGTDLTAASDLDIRQLALDLERNKELEALRQELGIPIETGLDLLRNSDGDIKLSVPVSGELGNPQFDFSDAINQAMGSAMKSAVLTILFPLGAVIAATEGGGSSIKLDPVAFRPGTSEMADGGRELLAKAAEFLGGSKGFPLRLCGYAVAEDATVLAAQAAKPPAGPAVSKPADEGDGAAPAATEAPASQAPPAASQVSDVALDNLASERAIRVKGLLIDEFGIDPKRLLLCRPRVDEGAAMPRVEILL